MSGSADRLALLRQRLLASFIRNDEPDVRLLSGDQLLITRNLMRNPAPGRRGKTETYTPGDDGYQIHVACRSAEAHAVAVATSQRITGPARQPSSWDTSTMRLRVQEADLRPEWRLTNGRKEIITVHVGCGSPRVLDEVNTILAEIEAVLLA